MTKKVTKLLIFGCFLPFFGHFYAFETPVRLSWVENPAQSMTMTWDCDIPGRGTVFYGLTSNYTHSVSDPGQLCHHVVTIRDLMPGTRYYYQVTSSDGYVSQPAHFLTAPAGDEPVRFAIHGDLHGGLDWPWGVEVTEHIVAEDPDFVIHIGDLSDEAYTVAGFSTWTNFVQITSNEVAFRAFMPAMGNHEVPETTDPPNSMFFRLFSLPGDLAFGQCFSYDVAATHFVVLNSDYKTSEQIDWLARDLQAAANDTNINWIIPYFHRPPYSWGEREGDGYLKTNWCPEFVRYEADVVFSGHSHNYQRTVPIRGVRYFVIGGGGASLYDSAFTPGSHEYATTCYHYATAAITNMLLNFQAVRSDGLVFDSTVITNEQRFVRVDPVFPRRGEEATIYYRPGSSVLSNASPVYIHWGLDDFSVVEGAEVMTDADGNGEWEYRLTVPTQAMTRLAFVFNDGGVVWHNNYDHDWQALLDRVSYVPDVPVAGSNLTIRYEADMGPLAGSGSMAVHIRFGDCRDSPVHVLPMSSMGNDLWEVTMMLPSFADQVFLHFENGTAFDRNSGHDWETPVAGALGYGAWPQVPLILPGSPVISSNPPVAQNTIGDNFDFNTNTPALKAKNGIEGFGDFGTVYFNYDETNLYIGGIAVDPGGSNNVLMLFVGMNTLSDDAWNLWGKSGLPNALDYLHNIGFSSPMDVAIIFGDEYGDGAAYTNFSYGGYNFGQGIYYLGGSGGFVSVADAVLSQFDGSGVAACVSEDDDGDRFTDRWEASLPWASLNASGVSNVSYLTVCGVIGSSSVDGDNRYLSSTYLGSMAYAQVDVYGQFAQNFVTLDPVHIFLPQGEYFNDGIPNEWRNQYFGTGAGPASTLDTDGDHQDTHAEYIAGTSPIDEQSYFQAGISMIGSSRPVLTWLEANGRLYTVYCAENLSTIFVERVSGVTGGSYTADVESVDHAFYRVEVELP